MASDGSEVQIELEGTEVNEGTGGSEDTDVEGVDCHFHAGVE